MHALVVTANKKHPGYNVPGMSDFTQRYLITSLVVLNNKFNKFFI
jgi:hypothetical protein